MPSVRASRRTCAALLLAATAAGPLGAAPASGAVYAAQIALVLRYDTTCESTTSCRTTLSGVACLEHVLGEPCTVDPVTFRLQPPAPFVPDGVCTLAQADAGSTLVVHTATGGDVHVRIQAFVAHGSVAVLAGLAGLDPLVATGAAGGTVTEVATRACPDVTDGRLAGLLALTAAA